MIRRAEEKDIPRIIELLVEVDMVHHRGRPDIFKGPATKYTEAELNEIIKNDVTPIFVSENSCGYVEGYAFCIFRQFTNDSIMTDIKTLYIDDLCVGEECRGKGVGSSLYRHTLEFAKSSGCYNVTLNVWSCNESAMRFYEKCGFVPQKVGMEIIL